MNVRLLVVPLYLRNLTTNFDITFHVAQVYIEEGFKIGGMSRYPLVWLQGSLNWYSSHISKMSLCPNVNVHVSPKNLCMCPLYEFMLVSP